MATVTLTVRYLDSLHSHGKRFEVFDALVPGLAIRVSASGRKSFTLYYRHQGRMRRLGLGRYPDVLLERARRIATQHRGRIFDGADPAGDKQAERAQNDHTVQALYDLNRGQHEKTLRSWSEVRRIMEREVLPVWRHRRVVDLHRRDIRELVERKARTAPIQANRMLQRISAMRSFAVDQDWIESNPAWRIKKPGRERSRDRVLTREELREVWAALHETEAKHPDGTPKPRLSQALNDMLIVMLLTAQRRVEVCTMRWQDVDLATGWWMIPAESSKNADPHRVPLTPMVLEILERRAGARNRDERYVFSIHRATCVADRAKKAAAVLCNGGVVPLSRARPATDRGVVHGRGRRRPLPHRAQPEPSECDPQHGDRHLRSLPLRQGEAGGPREMGRGAVGDRGGQARADDGTSEAGSHAECVRVQAHGPTGPRTRQLTPSAYHVTHSA
jgi:integrase